MAWQPYVIRPSEREWFKRCRRAWDFGASARRNLEPAGPPGAVPLERAVRDALAVYYFPGMWTWDREMVRRLSREALGEGLRGAPGGTPGDARQAREHGQALLEAYFAWAPTVDGFTPLRVEAEFDVSLPDPRQAGRDLVTPDDRPVRYRGRLDLLALEADGTYWIVEHRIGRAAEPGGWPEPDGLRLDERGPSLGWAWESFALGTRIAGTVFNEVTVGRPPGGRPDAPPFRRTRIAWSRPELEGAGSRLALEALDMTAGELRVYPHATRDNCGRCDFREPCLRASGGGDVEALLALAYRPRRGSSDTGRLGGGRWSLGRGAAPPAFGRPPPAS